VDCAMAAASSGTRACSAVLALLLLPRRSASGRNSLLRLQSMNLRMFHASDGTGATDATGGGMLGSMHMSLKRYTRRSECMLTSTTIVQLPLAGLEAGWVAQQHGQPVPCVRPCPFTSRRVKEALF
jgi:hypothetical protein